MSNGGNGVMSNYIMVMCLEPATPPPPQKKGGGELKETEQ